MKRVALYLALLMILICAAACTPSATPDVITPDTPEETPVIPSDNDENETEVVNITLYFPDNEALYLHKETREVELNKGTSLEIAVLDELFKGPKSEDLSISLYGENLVNSVETKDGVCTVDFKQDFVVLNSGGTTGEGFAIASVVNSLCELDGVESVRILIDGQDDVEFGHTILENIYKPFNELVAK